MNFNKPKKIYNFNTLINNGNIFYGSGGSSNSIIIYKNHAVKLIPNYKKRINELNKKQNDQEEIKFYKEFTKELINKNKTPHIVAYYDNIKFNFVEYLKKNLYKCEHKNLESLWEKLNKENKSKSSKITKFFKTIFNLNKTKKRNNTNNKNKDNKKNKYYKTKKSKLSKNKSDIVCNYKKINNKFYNERNKEIETNFDLTYLELCSTNISNEFNNLIKNTTDLNIIQLFIERILFQFMYTLCAICEKYPTFIHNDLFLRNILAVNETKYKPNDYVKYKIINRNEITEYYFPANGIYIKLNDFGYSFAMPKLGDKLLYKQLKNNEIFTDKYNITRGFTTNNKSGKDIWNFLYDLYDGENFGADSLLEIIRKSKLSKKQKQKLTFETKKIIHKFINTNVIDKINKNNKELVSKLWNINNIPELVNTYNKPDEYFKNNTFTSYSIKPTNCNIIKTFFCNINN